MVKAPRLRRRDAGKRTLEQLLDTVSNRLWRPALGDRDDSRPIGGVEVGKEGRLGALPTGDDGHVEARMAAWPFPYHRAPALKARHRVVHAAPPYTAGDQR